MCSMVKSILCLSVVLFEAGHILTASSSSTFEKICKGENGHLYLSPKNNVIQIITEGGGHAKQVTQTVFVQHNREFKFQCVYTKGTKGNKDGFVPQIDFKPGVGNSSKLDNHLPSSDRADRSLNSSLLPIFNAVNFKNFTVECKLGNPDAADDSSEEDRDFICRVNVIVIKKYSPKCSFNTSLSCRALDLLENIGESSPTSRSHSLPYPSIHYSIFIPENQTWVHCNETLDDGKIVPIGSQTSTSTESIVCPVPKPTFNGPVLIRVEESKKTGLSVGLPALSQGGNMSFTFISVYLNQTVYGGNRDQTASTPIDNPNESDRLITPIAVGTSLLALGCVVSYFVCKKCVFGRPKKDSKSSKFYVDHGPVEDLKGFDNLSMKTQSTNYYDHSESQRAQDSSTSIFEADNITEHIDLNSYANITPLADDEASVNMRRIIVARQLSGDLSKINPSLALNQQANALPYNPKLEIERCNFNVGELLGSGNFGSVYVGEAVGLFHPGSLTKVAIKTVNNALDGSQLAALLCEVKILANLDHHLNLVNLMGACTSELHNGELWLLLEFCGHGDLKHFLLQHRKEFEDNLKGELETDLNNRMFLKWAHSIAKGMEYLTSKRIMHGDLAARNILIGGSENYVAKVSDFGLSKTFYDNVSYKKKFRHYVPWKWMAIEYLKDACFTMKSDVWSYGVVLWEILSLGQEPYAGKSISEVVKKIKAGYRMPCPSEVVEVSWSSYVYNEVMKKCWDADPSTRCSFGEIVNSLERLLELDELTEYQNCSEQCKIIKEQILDDTNKSRRNTLVPGSSDFSISQIAQWQLNPSTTGYVTIEQAKSGIFPSPRSDDSSKEHLFPADGGYITVEQMRTTATVT